MQPVVDDYNNLGVTGKATLEHLGPILDLETLLVVVDLPGGDMGAATLNPCGRHLMIAGPFPRCLPLQA